MNPATATMLAASRQRTASQAQRSAPAGTKAKRPRRRKPTCGNCFFGSRGLCALQQDAPCPTHRFDTPDGLVPPLQPSLLARQDA